MNTESNNISTLLRSTFSIRLIGIYFLPWGLFYFMMWAWTGPCGTWGSDWTCNLSSASRNDMSIIFIAIMLAYLLVTIGLMKIRKWAKIPAIALLLLTFLPVIFNWYGLDLTWNWLFSKFNILVIFVGLLSLIYLFAFRGEWKSKPLP